MRRFRTGAEMISSCEQVYDQARLTAREFVESWVCETGGVTSGIVADRMKFAFEMGYLRGHGTGLLSACGALLRGEEECDLAGERARFAARAFVVSWLHEAGRTEEFVLDRLRLSYEMGYLRGHGAGLLTAVGLLQNTGERNVKHAE